MSAVRIYALVNMMGSKGECAISDGSVSFAITRGRGTANDVHVVCYGLDQQGGKGQANVTRDVAPTLCSDSHGTPHAIAWMRKDNGRT